MDEATRRAFTQALYNNRSQGTHNHMQSGAEPPQPPSGQPEHRTFHPNQHSSSTRIFSPLASSSTIQSNASATTPAQHTHQTNIIFYPNGVNSSTSSPALQHVHQLVQQRLNSSTRPSSSVNSTNQQMYQPSRLRPGPPYGQHSRQIFQPRHHPYGAPQSLPSQASPSYYIQDTLPTLSPGDLKYSSSRPDTPAQNDISTASQVQTLTGQELLRFLQEYKQIQNSHNTSQPQNQINPQMPSPGGTMWTPAQINVHHTPQSSSIGSSPSTTSQVQSPVQSYGRVHPPRSTQPIPLPGKPTSLRVPRLTPHLPTQGSIPSHGMTQPPIQSTAQTSQPTKLTPSRPSRTLQQPSPLRIWCPELRTVTYPSLLLQAQTEEESNHPNQERLVGKTQERSLANIRPHEFIDHLTMDHNQCFKPKVARVFDMLYMQALLFHKDHVLLVSPKELQTPCWEPPQSMWHTHDLYRPEVTSNTQVERHIYKALNLVSDLLPNEVIHSTHHERHDSAVDLVKTDGKLTYGWSVTVSFELRDETPISKLRNISPDRGAFWFTENNIKNTNMIPVWKAKVLEIFELRRAAKSAQ